jgi:hypothetical protein
MGRTSRHIVPAPVLKFSLQWVPINAGGYDAGGAYWGTGPRLYWAAAVDETTGNEVSEFYRAADRTAAKAIVRRQYPGAKFNGGGK